MSGRAAVSSRWTNQEWDEVVRGYAEMLRMEQDSIPYERTTQVEVIADRVGRQEIGVRGKLNQISMTLDALGHLSLPRSGLIGGRLTWQMRNTVTEALARNGVIDDPPPL